MTDFTINSDPTLMLLRNSKDGRQAKARAFANIFGGEAWLGRYIQAVAIIAHWRTRSRCCGVGVGGLAELLQGGCSGLSL